MGFYYSIITIVDILALFLTYFLYMNQITTNEYFISSNIYCKFSSYLIRILSQFSSWLNVIVTVDRVISIKYFSKPPVILKNRKFLSLLILSCLFLLSILNIPNLFFYTIVLISANNKTLAYDCSSSSQLIFARDLIIILFRMILPF